MVFQRLKSKNRIRTRPIAFRGLPRRGGSQNLASRLEIPCGYLVDTSLSHSPLPLLGQPLRSDHALALSRIFAALRGTPTPRTFGFRWRMRVQPTSDAKACERALSSGSALKLTVEPGRSASRHWLAQNPL